MAVFDWVEKHARDSVAKWAADGVVAATTATDAFDLSAWSPGVDSEPTPFKPADKSYARIRSLVPARCQIVKNSVCLEPGWADSCRGNTVRRWLQG